MFLLQRKSCFFSVSPTGGEKNLKPSLVRRVRKLETASAPSDLPVVEYHSHAFTYCLLPYLPWAVDWFAPQWFKITAMIISCWDKQGRSCHITVTRSVVWHDWCLNLPHLHFAAFSPVFFLVLLLGFICFVLFFSHLLLKESVETSVVQEPQWLNQFSRSIMLDPS